MSQFNTVKCDGEKCGKTKANDTNRWLVGAVSHGLLFLAANRGAILNSLDQKDEIYLHLTDTDDRDSSEPQTEDAFSDFCGEACAMKWVSSKLKEIKK